MTEKSSPLLDHLIPEAGGGRRGGGPRELIRELCRSTDGHVIAECVSMEHLHIPDSETVILLGSSVTLCSTIS